jgi:hypothetical protein
MARGRKRADWALCCEILANLHNVNRSSATSAKTGLDFMPVDLLTPEERAAAGRGETTLNLTAKESIDLFKRCFKKLPRFKPPG